MLNIFGAKSKDASEPEIGIIKKSEMRLRNAPIGKINRRCADELIYIPIKRTAI